MSEVDRLLAAALALPAAERVRVASELLRSVDPDIDDDAADAWATEITRREAVKQGTATLVDSAEAHGRVRAALRARRPPAP